MLTEGRKHPEDPQGRAGASAGRNLCAWAEHCFCRTTGCERKADDPAVILYSGGTTGITKGILLYQPELQRAGPADHRHQPHVPARRQDAGRHAHVPRLRPGRVHPLHAGQRRPLHPGAPVHRRRAMPSCSSSTSATSSPACPRCMRRCCGCTGMENADLSCLKGVFSGGDSLSIELKKKVRQVPRMTTALPCRCGRATAPPSASPPAA